MLKCLNKLMKIIGYVDLFDFLWLNCEEKRR
jgi:hypothetical protein